MLVIFTAKEARAQGADKALVKKYFMHGISHPLGHDVCPPHASFAEGMVFTIELGIYIREEALGVRLENDFVIGKDKNIDLMDKIPIEAEESEAHVRGQDIPIPKSSQACAEFLKGFHFLLAGHPSDDVPCEAAGDGGESVAVVIREGGESVAAAAEIDHLIQGHHFHLRGFPKLSASGVTVRGGSVMGVFVIAELRILPNHQFP